MKYFIGIETEASGGLGRLGSMVGTCTWGDFPE